MARNSYRSWHEDVVEDIKFLIAEMEREEKEAPDDHLPYQKLLKFFNDVRFLLNVT